MTRITKFGNRIIHNGTFCRCNYKVIDRNKKQATLNETHELDYTEYLALLYFLTIEEKRQDTRVKIKKEYHCTEAGCLVTEFTVYYVTDNGHKWKSVYKFDKFNSAAK